MKSVVAAIFFAVLPVFPALASGMLDARIVVPCAPGTALLKDAITSYDKGQAVPVCGSINVIFNRRDIVSLRSSGGQGRNSGVLIRLDTKGAARLARATAGGNRRIVLEYKGRVVLDLTPPALASGTIFVMGLDRHLRDALLADFNDRFAP